MQMEQVLGISVAVGPTAVVHIGRRGDRVFSTVCTKSGVGQYPVCYLAQVKHVHPQTFFLYLLLQLL